MSKEPLPGQNRRLKNINSILKDYKEPDIPDSIIKRIKKKFPELKDYLYLHSEEIQKDYLIQYVELDFSKISKVYKCTSIISGDNNNVKSIILRDLENSKNLKINPGKYYVFKVLTDFEIQINNINKLIHK